MVSSRKKQEDIVSSRSEFIQTIMEARENIEMMMEVPKEVRSQWIKAGFSETVAEQAALGMWQSMMLAGQQDNGS